MTGLMRAGAAGLQTAWRCFKALVIVAVVLVMLAFNVATLTWSGLNALMSTAIDAVTVLEPVGIRDRRAKEAAERALLNERARANRAVAEARRLTRDRNRLSTDLDVAQRRAAEAMSGSDRLRREVGRLTAELDAAQWVELNGKRVPVRMAVTETSRGIRDRTARVASANLGSMVGEAIPFYGLAIIVAATTYELKSSCDSMRDMYELEMALGVAKANDQQVREICGMQVQVPTKEEIWQKIKNSPSTVWIAATGALSEAGASISSLQAPDFESAWIGTLDWVRDWFK